MQRSVHTLDCSLLHLQRQSFIHRLSLSQNTTVSNFGFTSFFETTKIDIIIPVWHYFRKKQIMKKILNLIAVFLFSQSTWALSESVLMNQLNTDVIPYFQNHFQKNQFMGVNQVPIQYYVKKVSNPLGVIIFSPGQSEAALKYSEFLYDLKDLQYDFYIIDHRGQGYSGRMLPDPVKSHVDHFQDYVSDFSYLINTIVKPRQYSRSILMAHSMGGAIATGYLLNNPGQISAAILSAPMLQVNTGLFNNLSADLVASPVDVLGFGSRYAATQKPYQAQSRFEDNKETSSFSRFLMKKEIYNSRPEIQVGGTTYRWLKESLHYTLKIRTSTPGLLKTPTLIFQAGADQYVMSYGQDRFCEQLNSENCRIVRMGFEKSQHEILMETDSIRSYAIETIRNFIHSLEQKASE